MANNDKQPNDQQRKTRKDVLLTHKQREQSHRIRMAVLAIVGIIVAVLVIGIFVEYVIIRPQPVAVVNGTEIALNDWQEMVRFERAELIDNVESLSELLNGDIGQIQQFASQQINLLAPSVQAEQAMGNVALQQLIDDELIRQEAQKRGIMITDADIQAAIEENYNFYGGDVPPTPTPAGPEPTPTVTPIPAEGAEAAAPVPTLEPEPTATPVTEDAFLQEYARDIARINGAGASEDVFREAIAASLYREALQELIGKEAGVLTEAEQMALLLIAYSSEEEAQTALADIDSPEAFVHVWNTVRSTPVVTDTDPIAQEILWSTYEDIASRTTTAVADSAFELSAGDVSSVIVIQDENGENQRYILLLAEGREVRSLPESQIRNEFSTAMSDWLQSARISEGVILSDIWQSRIPTRPSLDDVYYRPLAPTAVPTSVAEPETGG